jgi:hypothetical protein
MTFLEFRQKLIARFWWILILIVVFNGLGWSWMNSVKYNSLSSFQLNLNKDFYEIENFASKLGDRVILAENNLSSSYSTNANFVAKYFQDFLLSGSTVKKIKDNGALASTSAVDKPQYLVSILGNAVVEVKYEFPKEEEALKFNMALAQVYKTEVEQWNNNKPEMLQIAASEPISTVAPSEKSIQLKILPSLAAIILGLALVVVVPVKKTVNKA